MDTKYTLGHPIVSPRILHLQHNTIKVAISELKAQIQFEEKKVVSKPETNELLKCLRSCLKSSQTQEANIKHAGEKIKIHLEQGCDRCELVFGLKQTINSKITTNQTATQFLVEGLRYLYNSQATLENKKHNIEYIEAQIQEKMKKGVPVTPNKRKESIELAEARKGTELEIIEVKNKISRKETQIWPPKNGNQAQEPICTRFVFNDEL